MNIIKELLASLWTLMNRKESKKLFYNYRLKITLGIGRTSNDFLYQGYPFGHFIQYYYVVDERCSGKVYYEDNNFVKTSKTFNYIETLNLCFGLLKR
jgi:hypothetical protein